MSSQLLIFAIRIKQHAVRGCEEQLGVADIGEKATAIMWPQIAVRRQTQVFLDLMQDPEPMKLPAWLATHLTDLSEAAPVLELPPWLPHKVTIFSILWSTTSDPSSLVLASVLVCIPGL